jgi:hypothetical protein
LTVHYNLITLLTSMTRVFCDRQKCDPQFVRLSDPTFVQPRTKNWHLSDLRLEMRHLSDLRLKHNICLTWSLSDLRLKHNICLTWSLSDLKFVRPDICPTWRLSDPMFVQTSF